MKRCEECIYCHEDETFAGNAVDAPWNACRRYPPIYISDNKSAWPVVAYDDWCGEHKVLAEK